MSKPLFIDAEMSEKYEAVEIKYVGISVDQPFQITKKTNGVFLYGCKTMNDVDVFLRRTSLESLLPGRLTARCYRR